MITIVKAIEAHHVPSSESNQGHSARDDRDHTSLDLALVAPRLSRDLRWPLLASSDGDMDDLTEKIAAFVDGLSYDALGGGIRDGSSR